MPLSKYLKKEIQHFLNRVDKKKVIPQLPNLHEAVFKEVNCLNCAQCCKHYSPRFKKPDIIRLSKICKLKESIFIDRYLKLDEDGDFVTKSQPCPFLDLTNNHCTVYDNRPSDCKRFPYTDEDTLLLRQNISLKNADFCPAVEQMFLKLLKKE